MSTEESINPIVEFFHKFLGGNLWILPLALTISSWIMYEKDNERWYFLFSAILFGIVTVLYLLVQLFLFLKKVYINHLRNVALREKQIKDTEVAKANEHLQKTKHASQIWKLVAHADKSKIEIASKMLSLEMFEENERIRFVPMPPNGFGPEHTIVQAFYHVSEYFRFQKQYYSKIVLIEREQTREGYYFYIEPYFYLLLKNFAEVGKWEKVSI